MFIIVSSVSSIKKNLEFLLWHSRNKSDYELWGCRFDPWPCSVGLGSGVAVSCGVGRRRSSDLVFLWHRPAATALIRPLGWEPPYVTGAALEWQKPKKKKKRKIFLGAPQRRQKRKALNSPPPTDTPKLEPLTEQLSMKTTWRLAENIFQN